MLGIVAVVNVINFIDGVDGLAAGVCAIAAIALAVIALSLDRNAAGVLAALTAGGALGFLRHGFPPASSFMGDTGSNLLGYLLATASVQGALKTNAVVALAFPLVVLAVPILDTGFVVAKRLKYRQPIYQADTLALPPPDGQHRLLPAAHARLPLRLDPGAGRRWRWPCASSPTATTTATSTLLWTAVMVALRPASRSPPASTWSTCWRSSSCAAGPAQSGDRASSRRSSSRTIDVESSTELSNRL